MAGELRVYVNERPVVLPPGARARDAIAAADPGLKAASEAGELVATDGRGIALDLDAPLENGAILRAMRSSRQTARPGHGDH
jgi:hypothetical protein